MTTIKNDYRTLAPGDWIVEAFNGHAEFVDVLVGLVISNTTIKPTENPNHAAGYDRWLCLFYPLNDELVLDVGILIDDKFEIWSP